MKNPLPTLLLLAAFCAPLTQAQPEGEGWIQMFNGENLDGWRITEENPGSFRVEDGILVADGPRAHLFFIGEDGEADFTDFEMTCKVLTRHQANSGIFFHTRYQPEGWPAHGYEAQINATHSDRRKTGSIWSVADILDDPPHEDDEWFEYTLVVRGSEITLKVNGEVVTQYTEPDDPGHETRRLSSGTVALQAHDPESVIHFKELWIRPL